MTSDSVVRAAFVTGSRAYGTPTDTSDIDLVVRVEADAMESLAAAGSFGRVYGESQSFRFGKLDLIACSTDAMYDKWRRGTEELKARAPVTRQEAVGTSKGIFAQKGDDES